MKKHTPYLLTLLACLLMTGLHAGTAANKNSRCLKAAATTCNAKKMQEAGKEFIFTIHVSFF